jgi:hypothetical protein
MAHEEWMKRQKAIKPIVTLDRLCKDMGVETLDDFYERVIDNDYTYSETYKWAIGEGKSEEEAEEIARKAEEASLSEASDKYMDAVVSVARELYAEHELDLTEDPKNCLQFHVSPTKKDKRGRLDWRSSLECIRQTINGVGMFEFDSVDCLLESGPYTELSAAMQHLHWIIDWPRVYGNGTAKSMVQRRLRY